MNEFIKHYDNWEKYDDNIKKNIKKEIKKLVSVDVISTFYKQEKYIERFKESLGRLSFNRLIIVNDSPGHVLELKGACVINNEKNIGLYNSKMVAIKESKADLILAIDFDDTVSNDYITLMTLLFLGTGSTPISETNIIKSTLKKRYSLKDKSIFKAPKNIKKLDMCFCGKLFERQNLNILIDKNIRYMYEDASFTPFALLGKDIIFASKAEYNYFINPDSFTNNYKKENHIDRIKVFEAGMDLARTTMNDKELKIYKHKASLHVCFINPLFAIYADKKYNYKIIDESKYFSKKYNVRKIRNFSSFILWTMIYLRLFWVIRIVLRRIKNANKNAI